VGARGYEAPCPRGMISSCNYVIEHASNVASATALDSARDLQWLDWGLRRSVTLSAPPLIRMTEAPG